MNVTHSHVSGVCSRATGVQRSSARHSVSANAGVNFAQTAAVPSQCRPNAGEHRGIHGAGLRQCVRTEQRKAEHDHEQRIQLSDALAPELVHRNRAAVPQARKTSRATVPRGRTSSSRRATDRLRKYKKPVEPCPRIPLSVAAERNIQIVAEPAGQRNVPAAPELP